MKLSKLQQDISKIQFKEANGLQDSNVLRAEAITVIRKALVENGYTAGKGVVVNSTKFPGLYTKHDRLGEVIVFTVQVRPNAKDGKFEICGWVKGRRRLHIIDFAGLSDFCNQAIAIVDAIEASKPV